jgi:hypothetical protein
MKMTAEEFNAEYPVRMAVRYYRLIDRPEHTTSRTRTPAWNLGDGSPVVSVDGRAGGLSLDHIEAGTCDGACATCDAFARGEIGGES